MRYALAHITTYIKREERVTCQLGAYAPTHVPVLVLDLPTGSTWRTRGELQLGVPRLELILLNLGTPCDSSDADGGSEFRKLSEGL